MPAVLISQSIDVDVVVFCIGVEEEMPGLVVSRELTATTTKTRRHLVQRCEGVSQIAILLRSSREIYLEVKWNMLKCF